MPKQFNDPQKQERTDTCIEFLATVQWQSKSILDNIVTRDELVGSFHTPETKQQSKQWLKRGISGPIKAKVSTSRTKLMMKAFDDSKGLIYKNYAPRRTMVSANCNMEALGRCMKVFNKNRLETSKHK